jgi:rod shape-determining protein MreC
VPAYVPEPESTGGGRQGTLAVTFLILALATSYLPDTAQQRVAWSMRVTVLRPFLGTRELLAEARFRAGQVEELQAQLDSMVSVASTQAALFDENRSLRDLLELKTRVGPSFLPATVLRPGTPGSESMFLVELGSEDGIQEGAPVVSLHGLVGRIREVREGFSVAMDWTHPDFRVSGMLADGTTYGMVEIRRGSFREDDRLVLNGTAYHESAANGTLVLSSGLGVFPRGIPIGKIDGTEDVQGQWRKSYWLRPMVEAGSVTHVLVGTRDAADDLSDRWALDSLLTRDESIIQGRRP